MTARSNDPGRPVPPHGSGPAGHQPHPEDVCECGDYRRQHDDRGCILCRNFPAPTGRCMRFRLFRPTSKSDAGPRENPLHPMFRNHNCAYCGSGEKACKQGNPSNCEYPHARND